MKKLLISLFVLAILLAGAAWWISAPRGVIVSEQTFTYAPLKHGAIKESVSATGRLQPTHTLVVGSETPGIVVEVFGEINQTVSPGETLVKLKDDLSHLKVIQAKDGVRTAEASVAQAKAMLTAAETALRYQRDLQKMGGFRSEVEKATVELEAAKAGVKMAESQLQAALTQKKQAELVLEQTLIKVPDRLAANVVGWNTQERNSFSPLELPRDRKYLILERNVQIGQTVGPQSPMPLFVLAGNLERMEVHTEVVEGDIGKIKRGQLAEFAITSYDDLDRRFLAKVREINPLPTNVRGAVYYNAILDVVNEKNSDTGEWRLRPGMTASVDVILREKENAWKVPVAALNFQMEEAYQSDEAKARLRTWRQKENWNDWRPIWVWQAEHQRVWPIFIRLSDSATGKAGIQDGEYHEVLEWEAGIEPGDGLPLIISAPPAREPGLLDRPANFKFS